MIEKCFPDYCVNSVWDLGNDFYKSNNIKAVIFDIDNTLVTHTTATPPEDVLEYFEFLKTNGIKYAIASNNNRQRVVAFCKDLNVPYIYRALKPRKAPLKKLAKYFDVPNENICLVGDQLFTDMLGANRMGFVSVVVTALGENETGFVSFKRIFEKMIMKKYLNEKNRTTNN